ncbi:MAG TPA: ribosome-associated translation inhibitor RaiA [Paludibacteraceae bacterium]|jgi:putative sigma-54 modulation protein|nr:ribosome-associated translation inhibitor RaiA [Paludibacteraceae bacterium]HQB69571.1 ribosome-associated translation inhibitor RaiA [Paludibacteraceae bacterium]
MEIRIQAVKFDASDRLQAHIEKKVTKLEKIFDSILTVDVYLKVVKPEAENNKEVNIKVNATNAEFFAAKVANTFEQAVDECVEALEKQIKKQKDKR